MAENKFRIALVVSGIAGMDEAAQLVRSGFRSAASAAGYNVEESSIDEIPTDGDAGDDSQRTDADEGTGDESTDAETEEAGAE